MSLVVFAGTAQIASLPLIASGAPLWVVWATVLCVNLRFVIFSAAVAALLGAPAAALAPHGGVLQRRPELLHLREALSRGREPAPEQWPYFWGGMVANWGSWQVSSLLGIALAHHLPMQWGLGFAGTAALLALTYSHGVGPRHLAGRCGGRAARRWPPTRCRLRLNILVAIAAAVAVGVVLDHTTPKSSRKAVKEAT